jgi:hypothetical protein
MRKRGVTRLNGLRGESGTERTVEYLIATAEPSRLFELYYWSREPELLEIVRACACLPEAQRRLIASFFSSMGGSELVAASRKDEGQLVLSCRAGKEQGNPPDAAPKSRARRS